MHLSVGVVFFIILSSALDVFQAFLTREIFVKSDLYTLVSRAYESRRKYTSVSWL